ncbi:MAG: hypothetical protein CO029_01675 [Candidatus Magasanikbacteria bacterium CG_4_9_14_0_2_um_filter_41_10]|uniref:Uncharacterized protein n=1 Tax=Candidatus Magasanikbacteria bacterium CG_4_10_14_0_2_um_filter_41_31 TaxID=1974639 RepID=A0A2M7V5E5_9BACT|nr:MAG: hypothetical protein AUJ37_05135 [Candidatus Magasanikbacteria bacterium CG1_02_41_34]PIZ93815.1 MAG: hypothetical protein COX83_00875 [Candidatus Magasanikbacteria bacterium CG_4_10_14_0_2_um_filter_41_31]PJC53667.1 MAG: hypothetical protein CO029_01675 [Candidatus Magasanikbacteria bacterium CG_4_9_14_0_2_um_filter_41_10]
MLFSKDIRTRWFQFLLFFVFPAIAFLACGNDASVQPITILIAGGGGELLLGLLLWWLIWRIPIVGPWMVLAMVLHMCGSL